MSKDNKKISTSVNGGSDGIPEQLKGMVDRIQTRHKKCWRPENNPYFPCCLVETDPTNVEAMMCLRILTLDRQRYLGWIVWYAAKMKEQLIRSQTVAKMIVEAEQLKKSNEEEKKQ
jgi:uncharacterized HAD superfamily protein